MSGQITTGADDLLKIVNKFNKISIKEASKILSVSNNVISFWMDTLVEDNQIDVDVKINDTFLIKKGMYDKPKFKLSANINPNSSLIGYLQKKIKETVDQTNKDMSGFKPVEDKILNLTKDINKNLNLINSHLKHFDSIRKEKESFQKELMKIEKKSKKISQSFHKDVLKTDSKIKNINFKIQDLIPVPLPPKNIEGKPIFKSTKGESINKEIVGTKERLAKIIVDLKDARDKFDKIEKNKIEDNINSIISRLSEFEEDEVRRQQQVIYQKVELVMLKEKVEDISKNIVKKRNQIEEKLRLLMVKAESDPGANPAFDLNQINNEIAVLEKYKSNLTKYVHQIIESGIVVE